MLISYKWIKNYVDLPDSLTPEELALKLTMSTVEVEGVEKQGKDLENIVVGLVKKVEKHPDADKLQVCTVFDGNEDWQVVCGGTNLYENMKVAFAKVGSRVRWHGEGNMVELAKAKIRGVESFGMICASSEIGLGELFPMKVETEILDLNSIDNIEWKVGSALSESVGLNDVIIDIDNKSMTHRPDLWGHYGMAREVASLYNKKLKDYKPAKIKEEKIEKIKVEVQDIDLCPRYMAVTIDGIKIAPSPDWMQKKLLAVGLKPINNIVDITNYILFDLGQPMHAFDRRDLSDDKIIVRRAEAGEEFTTLDDKKHKLTEDDLVIADTKKAVALAGIMGGQNSEVKDDTSKIVFESANFDASNVRRSATRLGLRTDSSSRFEKSLDPNNTELALERAVELTLEFCPDAKVVSNIVDEANFKLNQGPIELPLEFLNKKIGKEIKKKEVIKILESLGFGVKEKKDILYVTIPTWRATKDISIPEDLVEEVARIYGYGNIDTQLPTFPIIPPEKNNLKLLQNKIRDILHLKFAFSEVYNYSFISPKFLDLFDIDRADLIELDNPIAKDRPYLRYSLWPNMVENLEKNSHEFDSIKIFEIGKVFDKNIPGQRIADNSDDLLPRQDTMLGLAFSSKTNEKPFYELSEAVTGLLESFNCEYEIKNLVENKNSFLHPGRCANIFVGGELVGVVGEINPSAGQKIGIGERSAVAEINLDILVEQVAEKNKYNKLSVYPAIERDTAFLVDKAVKHVDVVTAIKNIDNLIISVELFDIFEGKNIEKNKKSMAYRITYLSDTETLRSEIVDELQKKVIKKLETDFGAQMRK